MASSNEDSVVVRRMKLSDLLTQGAVDDRVLKIILPNGIPLPDEDQFWDYKESLPNPPSDRAAPDARKSFDFELAKIIKDVVAFYNMNGGYLVIGIKDRDRSVVGWNHDFDAADLSKRVYGFTRRNIDLKYRVVPYNGQHLGLLYIPERLSGADPVQFIKSAPEGAGKRPFEAHDIFLRSRDECRPAVTAEDFSLLFRRDRTAGSSKNFKLSYLENNLPAKDPNLLDFVGREDQLNSLWQWFTERHTAIKLLSGPGGVGKTSIAWTFCDSVSHFPPEGIHKVVWLTAKRRTYAAVLG